MNHKTLKQNIFEKTVLKLHPLKSNSKKLKEKSLKLRIFSNNMKMVSKL